jgi:hypothetical protein
MSFDSLDDTQIKKKFAKETEDAEEKLLVNTSNYQIYEMKT